MNTASIPFAIRYDHTYLYVTTLTEQHRELYHRKQLDIICPGCGAALMIVLNKNEYYFRHFSNQSCILDSNKIQIDLIQYLADINHKGNKFKAAEEICHTLTIPYDNTKG